MPVCKGHGNWSIADRVTVDLQISWWREGRIERAGLAMTGGQKPGSDGTDPKAAGSNQQSTTQPQGANRPQQRDMTDQMDQFHKQDPATVERWFDRQLNQLYSEVISEPLPKDMQELIDKLREKTPTK
jgi:Anti-sigma factor NepR